MSRYKVNSKERKKKSGIIENEFERILRYLISGYVMLMLFFYPLYFQNKYYNMGEAKYFFFKNISLIFFVILLGVVIVHCFVSKKWKEITDGIKKLSVTDWFVLAYGAAVWLSFMNTPYKTDAVWGYPGWYMGLISQMIFIGIYFFVSRYLPIRKWMLHITCAVSAIVFLLAVLHRFQIDPLQLYEGLSIENKILFLSTMGQATWYSSYLCIVFPLGLFLYWNSEKRTERILYGCYVALGFSTMVTQNSDSAFMAFLFIFCVLFLFSFQSNAKMKRFLESLIIGLLAVRLIGILQILFSANVVPLENFSIEASQGRLTEILLLSVIIIYLLFSYLTAANKIHIVRWKKVGIGIVTLGIMIILLFVVCIILNAKGILPSWLMPLQQFEYFTFDDNWGNGRGFTWRCCTEIFQEYSLKNKIFGCGPDCFASYAYDKYAETMNARFGDKVLTNAHNEWFTSLLFFGVLGFVTYLGIFISQVTAGVGKVLKTPLLLAVIMAIAAYFSHNFFCYQQVICTPIIFILIGIGEHLLREKQ